MDGVSLFALFVLALALFGYVRSDPEERLGRLFFATLMAIGAAIGLLGVALRLLNPP